MVIVYGSGFRTRPEGQARIYFIPALRHNARRFRAWMKHLFFSLLHIWQESAAKYHKCPSFRDENSTLEKFIRPTLSFQFWPASGLDLRSVCKMIPIRPYLPFKRERKTKLMGSGI